MVRFLFMLGLAGFLGVLSANYVVQGRAGLVNTTTGQWVWWPSAGSTAIDPYTKFHFIAERRLPLSKFETFEVEASQDAAGRSLSSDCVYQLSGRMPEARWWSVSSFVPDGGDRAAGANETLGANDVIVEQDGTIVMTIASEIQPGNWLKPTGDDDFSVLLRLYAPANNLGSGAALSRELPTITRRNCR